MDREAFRQSVAPYQGRITIDIGTGDGLFVYNSARQQPERFFIGLDANRSPLLKISEKIHRRPARGGLPNVMYVQAAVEALPDELSGVADEIYVNFPWGSLLRGIAAGDELVLRNLRRLCAPQAILRILFGLDAARDRSELARLELPELTEFYLSSALPARYAHAGLEIIATQTLAARSEDATNTSWAKRLGGNANRKLIQIVATTLE